MTILRRDIIVDKEEFESIAFEYARNRESMSLVAKHHFKNIIKNEGSSKLKRIK